jgi:hypothetical protein
MHTEDDTFRVLARPNIHEMARMYAAWKKSEQAMGTFNTLKNIGFMKYYGWRWSDFLRERSAAGYPTV